MRPWRASKLQMQLDRAIAWREHAEYLNKLLRAENNALKVTNAEYFKRLPKAAPLDASGKLDEAKMPTGVKPTGVVARDAYGKIVVNWEPRRNKWRPYSKWEYDPPI